jgi:CheY-like chemotaxis protein
MSRILIVDDDANSARSLSRMLRKSGHDETRVEHSAATALQAATEFVPSIIFVDIELPEVSGYDVALLLHQHPVDGQRRAYGSRSGADSRIRAIPRETGIRRSTAGSAGHAFAMAARCTSEGGVSIECQATTASCFDHVVASRNVPDRRARNGAVSDGLERPTEQFPRHSLWQRLGVRSRISA